MAAQAGRARTRGAAGAAGAIPWSPIAPYDGPRRAWASLAAWNAAIWLVAFAWYAPIVASRRLLFPIFPLLLPPVLDVVGGWVGAWGPWRTWSRTRVPAAARRFAFSAVVVGTVAVAGYAFGLLALGGSPSSRVAIAPVWVEAADAMRRNCPRGSRVLVRPSRTYPPDWLLEGEAAYVELPAAIRGEDVPGWLAHEADFVLENEGLIRARPVLRTLGAAGVDAPDPAWGLLRVDPPGRLVPVATSSVRR